MRIILGLAAMAGVASCAGGLSGPIGSACLDSGRSAASPILCSCVQGVADQSLSRSDQRRAAAFFDDPDRAQDTRTRDDTASEEFWLRYRTFATTAERSCG